MRWRLGATVVLALAGATAGLAFSRSDEARFPHAKHKGLFPTCIGCHAGVLEERAEERYPRLEQCAGCHDGREVARVEWDGSRREPSNLRFSHAEHNREADLGVNAALNCRSCHAQSGDTAFMAVQRERATLCIACHEHRATAHLVDAQCRTCHVTLAQARALPDSTIAAFRKPPSHERPDFLQAHGATAAESQARCSVCHARESCARCHVNAANVPAIAALESDPRVGRLVAMRGASYPVPPSHTHPDFVYAHGSEARARVQSCGTCHTQPSCRACHTGRGASGTIAKLPPAGPGAPLGVQLPRPGSQRSTGTGSRRGPGNGRKWRWRPSGGIPGDARPVEQRAASSPARDATRESSAAIAMAAKESVDSIPPNFVVRHAPEGYWRQRDCASCHNTEVFCKDCHQANGAAATGRRDVAFHNAQPLWLLQHGQAARQGLESCAGCHAQRDCMQCHSTLGWGISPHGPGFDPSRMSSKNNQTCGYCHVGGAPPSSRE